MYLIVTDNKTLVDFARQLNQQIVEIAGKTQIKEIDLRKEIKGGKNEKGNDIDSKLSTLLKSIGITPNYLGFKYIKFIVMYYLKNPDAENYSITQKIYPICAKEFRTTQAKTERCIRTAISKSSAYSETTQYISIFGPTNAHMTSAPFLKCVYNYACENLV